MTKELGSQGPENGVIVFIKAIYFLFWHSGNIEAAEDFFYKENALDEYHVCYRPW